MFNRFYSPDLRQVEPHRGALLLFDHVEVHHFGHSPGGFHALTASVNLGGTMLANS